MSHNDNVTPIIKKAPQSFIQCFSVYLKMTFFKATPDEVPCDVSCLIKSLVIYCMINLWLLDVHSSAQSVISKIGIEMLLMITVLFIGLKVTKKQERFLQSLSSLVGIGMIISLISIPVYYLFIPQFLQDQEINQTVINITLVLLIWNLAVMSHIFKRSFEVSTFMAATISFNYLIIFEVIIISMTASKA